MSLQVANQVASRTHQINKVDLGVKLYYENIGPDPFFKELKLSRLKDSIEEMLIKRTAKPNTPVPCQVTPRADTKPIQDEFETKKKEAQKLLNQLTADKMEKKFDVNNLSAQQAECIIQLHTLYSELNTTTPANTPRTETNAPPVPSAPPVVGAPSKLEFLNGTVIKLDIVLVFYWLKTRAKLMSFKQLKNQLKEKNLILNKV